MGSVPGQKHHPGPLLCPIGRQPSRLLFTPRGSPLSVFHAQSRYLPSNSLSFFPSSTGSTQRGTLGGLDGRASYQPTGPFCYPGDQHLHSRPGSFDSRMVQPTLASYSTRAELSQRVLPSGKGHLPLAIRTHSPWWPLMTQLQVGNVLWLTQGQNLFQNPQGDCLDGPLGQPLLLAVLLEGKGTAPSQASVGSSLPISPA